MLTATSRNYLSRIMTCFSVTTSVCKSPWRLNGEKILNKCINSVLVYKLFYIHAKVPYHGILAVFMKLKIQTFKKYSYLVGRKNRLDTNVKCMNNYNS